MQWKFDIMMVYGIEDGCQLLTLSQENAWVVRFYDDDETTEVNFPDKDV